MGLADKIFGKKLSPEEYVREWKRRLKQESREIDKSLRSIAAEEAKIKKTMKESARKDDMETVKILAREMVQSRKAKARLYKAKAQINSVTMQLQQQAAEAKVMGALQKSTQIMVMMNSLSRVPELSRTMQAMSREMQKAGLMQEMMDDAFETMEDEDEEEEESVVNQILDEVVGTQLMGTTVGSKALKGEVGEEVAEDEDVDEELADRLKALRQ